MTDNYVQIGDKVIIGGLYGDDFVELNNKIGTIEKIMFTSSEYYTTYLVDVNIKGEVVPVNLAYIYRVDDLDLFDYYELTNFDDPFEFYKTKFRIVGQTHLLVDQLGKSYLYCKTRENNMQPLVLTNLN